MSFEEQIMSNVKYPNIFSAYLNGGYCVYCPSNMFCNTCGLENKGISLGYSPVLAGDYSAR